VSHDHCCKQFLEFKLSLIKHGGPGTLEGPACDSSSSTSILFHNSILSLHLALQNIYRKYKYITSGISESTILQ